MGGKGRSAGHEMYTGMTPTQEFNARLKNASDYYTPEALRTPDSAPEPAREKPEISSVAPSPAEGDTIASVASGQAPVGKLTTTQDTGDALGRTVITSKWQEQAAPGESGGLGKKLTGQV